MFKYLKTFQNFIFQPRISKVFLNYQNIFFHRRSKQNTSSIKWVSPHCACVPHSNFLFKVDSITWIHQSVSSKTSLQHHSRKIKLSCKTIRCLGFISARFLIVIFCKLFSLPIRCVGFISTRFLIVFFCKLFRLPIRCLGFISERFFIVFFCKLFSLPIRCLGFISARFLIWLSSSVSWKRNILVINLYWLYSLSTALLEFDNFQNPPEFLLKHLLMANSKIFVHMHLSTLMLIFFMYIYLSKSMYLSKRRT